MEPIYKSSLISFIHHDTHEPIAHPDGDYSDLNIKLKRLESLIDKYQPTQLIAFLYQPPLEKALSGKEKVLETIFSLRDSNHLPTHGFVIPDVGYQSGHMTFIRCDFNDFNSHVSALNTLVDSITSRMENEYDAHPLHYNKQVEFRQAKYVENRQAFSFWPANKPFGEYPLSKPVFDNLVEQLNATNENYKIYIDFVSDWEEKHSSLYGPPQSYFIEISISLGHTQTTIQHQCSADHLALCEKNHDELDKLLQPLLQTLCLDIAELYNPVNTQKKHKI